MTPAQVAHIMALFDRLENIAVDQAVHCDDEPPEYAEARAAVEAALRDAPTEAKPAQPHPDTVRLDAMEQRRIALIPEYEGPWDAQLYGEGEVPWVVGTSSTLREAIDAALKGKP